MEPAAVSGERAGCADHTVARHDDGDQVAAVCQTDGAGRTWTAELFGNLAVATDLAVRDRCQRLPDFELERRADRMQRKVELGEITGEIRVELTLHLGERCGVLDPFRVEARPVPASRCP